jgi:hypothetical protein
MFLEKDANLQIYGKWLCAKESNTKKSKKIKWHCYDMQSLQSISDNEFKWNTYEITLDLKHKISLKNELPLG